MNAQIPAVERESSTRSPLDGVVLWDNKSSPGSVLGGPLHEALDQHPDERKC